MKNRVLHSYKAFGASYSQVFFADSVIFSLFLLAASLMDPSSGLSGILAVLFTLGVSKLLGLNSFYLLNGTYTFNALLTGMVLGSYYQLTGPYLIILFSASLLTLLLTLSFASLAAKNKLPFLSLPFVISIWIVLLNNGSFENTLLLPRLTESHAMLWGEQVNTWSRYLELQVPGFLSLYFRSLSAVFFQKNLIAGLLICIGMLLHSRIAFLLSLLGFATGLVYFQFTHAAVEFTSYPNIAFNFILSALALGGYFLIPSWRSFLLTLVLTPLIGLLLVAISKLVVVYGLPAFSLSYSVAVIMVLALLNNRYSVKYLHLVYYQQFHPEKNLYAFHSYMERFNRNTWIDIHLPFFGEWTVSQGHDGEHTHKNEYRYGLDFVVRDEQQRSFKFPGKKVEDFYCYGLPVLAPADGEVVLIEDGIEDNVVGDANLAKNWGNTIVIKHSEALFSKMSHLKNGSFKVRAGDKVKRGDLLALCGNSGRSPEPHIHFQLQNSAKIGAPSIHYPISAFISKKGVEQVVKFYEVPKENETLLQLSQSATLAEAFHFIPGMKFSFEVTEGQRRFSENWEVQTDSMNHSYIKCQRTGSVAYFASNVNLFYFTGFEGDTECLLFYFYTGAYKILLSETRNLKVEDTLSLDGALKGPLKIVQDFLAPFVIFIKPVYTSLTTDPTERTSKAISIHSKVCTNNGLGRTIAVEMLVTENGLQQLTINEKQRCITAKLHH